MTKFINTELESESESVLEPENEFKAELESDTNNCNVFTHFVLNYRWLLADFEKAKNLVVISQTLLILNKLKTC